MLNNLLRSKALPPIEVTLVGKLMLDRLLQCWNELPPIDLTLVGIVTDVIEQYWNA